MGKGRTDGNFSGQRAPPVASFGSTAQLESPVTARATALHFSSLLNHFKKSLREFLYFWCQRLAGCNDELPCVTAELALLWESAVLEGLHHPQNAENDERLPFEGGPTLCQLSDGSNQQNLLADVEKFPVAFNARPLDRLPPARSSQRHQSTIPHEKFLLKETFFAYTSPDSPTSISSLPRSYHGGRGGPLLAQILERLLRHVLQPRYLRLQERFCLFRIL